MEFQKYVTRKLLKNQSHARILLKKHSVKEMKHSWLEICEQKIIEKIKYQREGMLPVRNSEIWDKNCKESDSCDNLLKKRVSKRRDTAC